MRKPIHLDESHLSSIISAMLAEKGVDEFTLTFEKYNEPDLGNFGLASHAEYSGDKDYPDSITVTVLTKSEIENGH